MAFTPYVGQVVGYKIVAGDLPGDLSVDTIRPALVTKVPSGTLCDLDVFVDDNVDRSGPRPKQGTILVRPSCAQGTSGGNYNAIAGYPYNPNAPLSVYGAGTAYVVTNVSAVVDMGTTDPTLVISAIGSWALRAWINLKFNGATFAAVKAVTIKLRRTNNTAADVTGSTAVFTVPIVTTVDHTAGFIHLPEVIYTTALATDSISIFIDVATAPSAGSLDVIACGIIAMPVTVVS